MNKITAQKVVRLFRRNKPKTAQEIRELGIPIHWAGSGVFRSAYKIRGLSIIIKTPRVGDSTLSASLRHAAVEIKNFKKLRGKKYKRVHRFLPKIYYVNEKNGIMVMRKYRLGNYSEDALDHPLFLKILGKNATGDLHSRNIARSGKQLKIIDLGFRVRK